MGIKNQNLIFIYKIGIHMKVYIIYFNKQITKVYNKYLYKYFRKIFRLNYKMGNTCQTDNIRTSLNLNTARVNNPSDALINLLRSKFEQYIKRIVVLNQTAKTLNQYFSYKNLTRGDNFEGKFNGTQINGIGIYHKKQAEYYIAYLGTIQNGMLKGRGLQIKIKINPQIKNRIQLDFNQTQILYLQNWEGDQNKNGCFIVRNDEKQQIFNGKFTKNKQLLQGTLKFFKHGILSKKYVGQFNKNKFHGKGILEVPGQYKYEGQFEANQRSGLGIQENIAKKFVYIGQFKENQKDGYGQVIYKSDKNVKLKGFWKDGIMLKQSGVFLDQNSELLSIYQIKMGTM